MDYKLEVKEGKINLYSSKIGMYLMEETSIEQVKIAIATEMEYKVKLEIIKLLMTFPHGFYTMDNEIIVNQEAMDEYEAWYKIIRQKIGTLEDYYDLIDEKISTVL